MVYDILAANGVLNDTYYMTNEMMNVLNRASRNKNTMNSKIEYAIRELKDLTSFFFIQK